MSPTFSHCAGDTRHLDRPESEYVESYTDNSIHSPTLYTSGHGRYNMAKAKVNSQDVLMRSLSSHGSLRMSQNNINNAIDSGRGVSPMTEDLTESNVSRSRRNSTDSISSRMGQFLGVSSKVIDVADPNCLEFGFVVLRRKMRCIDVIGTTLKHLNMKSQLPNDGVIAKSIEEGILTDDQKYIIADIVLSSKVSPKRISLFEVDVHEAFEFDESSEVTVIRGNLQDIVASTQSSPKMEKEALRSHGAESTSSTYKQPQMSSSSPTIPQQNSSRHQHPIQQQLLSMETGMSSPMDTFNASQQQQQQQKQKRQQQHKQQQRGFVPGHGRLLA